MTLQLRRVGARDEAGLCTNRQDPLLAGARDGLPSIVEPQSGVHGPMRPESDCCGANEVGTVGLSLCTQSISVRNAFERWSRSFCQPRQYILCWGKSVTRRGLQIQLSEMTSSPRADIPDTDALFGARVEETSNVRHPASNAVLHIKWKRLGCSLVVSTCPLLHWSSETEGASAMFSELKGLGLQYSLLWTLPENFLPHSKT